MRERSPQEKKGLSYAKDCRNMYGENDKASRKSLPRKRARVHRASRHRARQTFGRGDGPANAERSDSVQQRLLGRRPHVFHKFPNLALGEAVRWQLARRGEK